MQLLFFFFFFRVWGKLRLRVKLFFPVWLQIVSKKDILLFWYAITAAMQDVPGTGCGISKLIDWFSGQSGNLQLLLFDAETLVSALPVSWCVGIIDCQ